jgi:hypothetical protein
VVFLVLRSDEVIHPISINACTCPSDLNINPSSSFAIKLPSLMDANISRLFTANSQWANAVRASEPDFFATSAKGQSPKVVLFQKNS